MTRYLPIALLALGLVLAFTVFAAAKTPELTTGRTSIVCIDDTRTPPTVEARQSEQIATRCWKKLRLGLAVGTCVADPVLNATDAPAPHHGFAHGSIVAYTANPSRIVPDLNLPPPRS